MNIDLGPFETCSNKYCCILKQIKSKADWSYAMETMPHSDGQKYGWMDGGRVDVWTRWIQYIPEPTLFRHDMIKPYAVFMNLPWLKRPACSILGSLAPITAMHTWWMGAAEGPTTALPIVCMQHCVLRMDWKWLVAWWYITIILSAPYEMHGKGYCPSHSCIDQRVSARLQ